jgi:hypothetical protein
LIFQHCSGCLLPYFQSLASETFQELAKKTSTSR